MRSRNSLIPFILIVLLILILTQNGVLSSLLLGLFPGLSSQNTSGSTAFPPGNQVLPPSNFPPAYAPTYPPQAQPQPPVLPSGNQTSIPLGAVGANGQCIVPSGWVPYIVQAGETLAVIAQRYNLTAEQLAAANCLQNPDMIYEAQVLTVPGTP